MNGLEPKVSPDNGAALWRLHCATLDGLQLACEIVSDRQAENERVQTCSDFPMEEEIQEDLMILKRLKDRMNKEEEDFASSAPQPEEYAVPEAMLRFVQESILKRWDVEPEDSQQFTRAASENIRFALQSAIRWLAENESESPDPIRDLCYRGVQVGIKRSTI